MEYWRIVAIGLMSAFCIGLSASVPELRHEEARILKEVLASLAAVSAENETSARMQDPPQRHYVTGQLAIAPRA